MRKFFVVILLILLWLLMWPIGAAVTIWLLMRKKK